jgi:hypothetical protein
MAKGSHGIGPRQGMPPWPGITTGHDARCDCTWAPRDGVYQVKYQSAGCVVHLRTGTASRG